MPTNIFTAMIVSESDDHGFVRRIADRELASLPQGEVLIRVRYSSLNYKDALSASGNKGVTRQYPHTPGIDAAGTVVESANPEFRAGDQVIVTGYDLGMNTSGGFGQYIRVPADWVVPLPPRLSLRDSMICGTAGFTAALCVRKLQVSGVAPRDGDILVTGATGGVGSLAVAILHKLGYDVVAVTGKARSKDRLLRLGAKAVLLRDEFEDRSGKPLIKGSWAGAVDTVGGTTLATVLKSTKYGGCVTCCGNAASYELPTTVYPFILRGVSLIGVDSVQCPMPARSAIWRMLAEDWRPERLRDYAEEVTLAGLDAKIDAMLAGQSQGRTIVNLD